MIRSDSVMVWSDYPTKKSLLGGEWWWVGGWLDQVGIRLTQLSTGLKVEAELGNKKIYWFQFFDLILDHKKFSGPKKVCQKRYL